MIGLKLAKTCLHVGSFFSKISDLIDQEWWSDFWYIFYNWFIMKSYELDNKEEIWERNQGL